MCFSYKSYAKINLFLHIIGKKSNGYHLLESLIAFTDIFDLLDIKLTKEVQSSLEINGEFANDLLLNNQNLILKAFDNLKNKYNITHNIKVHLNKNIPLGGGLGGGSSNAAITLLACNEIFNLQLSSQELIENAKILGADVAVCLRQPSCAFMEGIGEYVTPLANNKKFYIILINPNIHINTKQIFSLFSCQKLDKKIDKQELFKIKNADALLNYIVKQNNSLETIAIKVNNKIRDILELLQSTKPVLSRMTGSGSTCFAIYNNLEEQTAAFNKLINYNTNFWLKKTSIWLP